MPLPESARLGHRHFIEGDMTEAREKFYELAATRVHHLNGEETKRWVENATGIRHETNAVHVVSAHAWDIPRIGMKKWIDGLEIIINDDAFQGFEDMAPFIVEHEVYEAWISAKKGRGPNLDSRDKHLLARRREYLMAVEQNKGERLLEYHILRSSELGENAPIMQQECKEALAHAKKQVEVRKRTTQE